MEKIEAVYAIIAFGDVEGTNAKLSAASIFTSLFEKKTWYTTRWPKSITVGSTILFYQSKVGFTGSAVVREVNVEPTSSLLGTQLYQTFSHRLRLSECTSFSRPVNVRHILDKLDFVSNKKYYGHSFRSTPRRISQSDYLTIIAEADK